ncbi:hypothetical protein DM860_005664 [Cuscuta australis]|uniref:HMA domain-containing protein n=1 Tax=Cuscuta australis TaxID=267555 RepID=A0A328DSH8_9ASTE|nr:hypothetical protein DM860_005664 [Cuscuta australis]
MAASSSEAPPPPDEQQQQPPSQSPLPYKTWVLKVPIHCQACKRKVKKVLHTVDGVYITEIDEREHKVTVTGNVEADALIKKLLRSGKTADLWPPPENDKKSKNRKNGDEEEEEEDDAGSEEDREEDKQPPAPAHQKAAAGGGATAVRFHLPPHPAPPGDGPDKKKKKNKKKKKKNKKHDDAAAPPCDGGAPANTGNEAWMVGPPYYPHMYPPPSYYHPLPPPQQQTAYVVSYNNNNAATHPGGGTAAAHYLAPPTYYTRAEVRAMRCRPLDSFEIVEGGILDEETRLVWLENCSNDEERHEKGNDEVAKAPAEQLGAGRSHGHSHSSTDDKTGQTKGTIARGIHICSASLSILSTYISKPVVTANVTKRDIGRTNNVKTIQLGDAHPDPSFDAPVDFDGDPSSTNLLVQNEGMYTFQCGDYHCGR